jgi:hypothetical protein
VTERERDGATVAPDRIPGTTRPVRIRGRSAKSRPGR